MTQHLALPLRLVGSGLATVEDGSPAEVGQSVAVLLATRPGERRSEPRYGSADPLFLPTRTGDAADSRSAATVDRRALTEFEPRAEGLVDVTQYVTTSPTTTTRTGGAS